MTEDGFVFRVDMRLRPFGDSGPLVASFAVLRGLPAGPRARLGALCLRQGARAHRRGAQFDVVARARCCGRSSIRRYLDFGVFDSLREMKALIARDVERRELADSI